MMDRALAIIGIALALIFGFAPYWVHETPVWLSQAGVAFGIFLVGVAVGLFARQKSESVQVGVINTSLRLQFYGDQRIPTEIYSGNVSNWYAIWTPSATVVAKDAVGKEIERHIFPKNWIIFLIFQKPTKYRQLVVSFSSGGFPPYEVKQSDSRFAIIAISGDIPLGELEIHTRPQ